MKLSPFRPEDFPTWRDLRASSAAYLQPVEPTWRADELSHDRFANMLRCQQDERERGVAYAFAIRRGNGDLVGALTLGPIRRGPLQSAGLGTWVGLPFAGRGYAIRATVAALQIAFDGLLLHRVEASVLPGNLPSIRGMEHLGFRREGLAQEFMQVGGVWRDHFIYAITERAWHERNTRASEQQARCLCGQGDKGSQAEQDRARRAQAGQIGQDFAQGAEERYR